MRYLRFRKKVCSCLFVCCCVLFLCGFGMAIHGYCLRSYEESYDSCNERTQREKWGFYNQSIKLNEDELLEKEYYYPKGWQYSDIILAVGLSILPCVFVCGSIFYFASDLED